MEKNTVLEASCTSQGIIRYTAELSFEGEKYINDKYESISALGHDDSGEAATCETDKVCAREGCGYVLEAALGHSWSAPAWTWTGNAAWATFTCANANHPQTISAAVTSATTPATCTLDGETVYTAKLTFGETEYTDTKTVTIPASGHSYAATVTPPTHAARGYTTYACANCGDAYRANYTAALDYSYSEWTPNNDGTHSAANLQSGHRRTETANCEALEATVNGEILRVCPVCGAFRATAFAKVDAKFAVRETGALPARGELVVRGMETPFDGALYAVTAAYVYDGHTVSFKGLVQISIPVEIAAGFRLVRVDVTATGEIAEYAEVWTEIPFTYEDGILTFEIDAAGLFLLLPAE